MPSNLAILVRPVAARATRTAERVASDPVFAKRIRSRCGMCPARRSAYSIEPAFGIIGLIIRSSWRRIAASTCGWLCPSSRGPAPISRSTYSCPSTSVITAPAARSTNTGYGAKNLAWAFTPCGKTVRARSHAAALSGVRAR